MRRTLFLSLSLVLLACGKPPPASNDPTSATPTTTPTEPTADTPTEPEAPLPKAEEVLEQSVVALGGRDKLDAIKSFHSQAKMEIPSQGITGTIKTWWKQGDFYMENEITGVGMTKVWKKGEEIWAEDPINGRRKLEGKEAAQSQWSASISLAADWKKYFEKAETVGRRKDGGAEVIDVKLTDKNGTEVTIGVDAKSFLPIQQSFAQETPMGNIPVHVAMDDYRDVAGVKTSFRSTTSMAVVTATQTVEKFEPNVEIDDKTFTPPKKEAKPAKGGAKAPAKSKTGDKAPPEKAGSEKAPSK